MPNNFGLTTRKAVIRCVSNNRLSLWADASFCGYVILQMRHLENALSGGYVVVFYDVVLVQVFHPCGVYQLGVIGVA